MCIIFNGEMMHTGKSIFFLLLLVIPVVFSCGHTRNLTIGYLILPGNLTSEDSLATQWLRGSDNFQFAPVRSDNTSANLEKVDILWVHITDSLRYREWTTHQDVMDEIAAFYRQGGRVLFTDYAALLPHKLGIETQQPEVHVLDIKDDWLFDKKGFQSFRGHPVFTGLFGGAFIWDAYQDHKMPTIGFFEDKFPQQGKVVGTEKSYIKIHGDNKLLLEYGEDSGKAISAGGFIYFGMRNRLDYKMKKFLSNCFLYLGDRIQSKPVTYWRQYDHQPKKFTVKTAAAPVSQVRTLQIPENPELQITRRSAEDASYDVEGRRALIMGKEKGGIEELWVHPFRVLRDYQAGIIVGDSVAWLKNMPVSIEVLPESFVRTYQTPLGELQEIVLPALRKAGGIVHYRAAGNQPMKLVVKFRSDLRWMWPYDEKAIGDVWYGYDDGLNALHLKDSAGDFYCIMGGDTKPAAHLSGQYSDIMWDKNGFRGESTDLNQAYHATEFSLDDRDNYILNFVMVGTDNGKQEALQQYRDLMADPQAVYAEAQDHFVRLLHNALTIESPDKEFNNLWKWAVVGTDRFLVETPKLGKALVAGYSTTAHGWDGAQKISGRPGYAWYFGRDSEWSSFAIDDYGDFKLVRRQLQFLQKFQDLSGKIFHEISTSGVVHYDASDATPLYIILAAHYLRASGDVDFIRESWPHIRKAMDFLYSTDTDGDKLIENTNVGHGWVEGGKLWGAHTTFYLAGLWAKALEDAAYMAKFVDQGDLASAYSSDAKVVRDIVRKDFWNQKTRFYNYGKMPDGSYNEERTALPAVVMYFDLLDSNRVSNMLDEYASDGFSSDWGVRIVSTSSPLFSPQGYHYGSIWPLFTGWTALAEYNYGNSVQGFMHMSDNMYIKNYWAKGFVEEVMNGAVYKPSGVCSHQCWSETNVLHPGIRGMVGWQPDAPELSATLAPRFPLSWDSVNVHNLRAGGSVIDFRMEQSPNETRYTFTLKEGPSLKLNFAPGLMNGMEITSAVLDNNNATVSSTVRRGALETAIPIDVSKIHELVIRHKKGIGMIPETPRPEPGATSQGYRIIRSSLKGNRYTVVLEGKAATGHNFRLRNFWKGIENTESAEIISQDPGGYVTFHVEFPKSSEAFVQKTVSFGLK